MAKKITCNTDNKFLWGDDCVGWYLLNNPELLIVKEVMPAHTKEIKHYHRQAQQLFYIIEGSATFNVEDEILYISSSESLFIKSGEKHQILNETENDLVFLVIAFPSTANDRVDIAA